LEEQFHFIYKAAFDNGLTEYEFDRVFFGEYDGEIIPNPDEVAAWRWISWEVLKKEIAEKPECFAPWFRNIISQIER
jgi:isopentenyl-diphosphate delta-isomerase